MLTNPIPLDLAEIVPGPEMFRIQSETHGQQHVARVMIHAFRLLDLTGQPDLAVPLWAAVYLHDLAREHDGRCLRHGRDAADLLDHLPETRELYRRGGLKDDQIEAVKFAVANHCGGEVDPDHRYRPLTALLKDADGLDRVRLYDLDPSYLRHPETPTLIPFAERLYHESRDTIGEGPGHFERLWPVAASLARSTCPSD